MAKVQRHMVHEQSFQDMLDEVRDINPDAAWFVEEAANRGLAKRCGFLTYVFTFRGTPQGHEFWSSICDRIKRGWDRDQLDIVEYELDEGINPV